MSEALVEMFRHNAWANDCLYEACEGLSDEQLDATVVGTFGSIRNTLVHIAAAQSRFAGALAGSDSTNLVRESDPFPGVAKLRDAVRESSEMLVEAAANAQSGATVTTPSGGENFTLPVWLLLLQAYNHATDHRSQISTILTQLGIEPPNTDGWTYHEVNFDADWSRLWSS